MTTRYLPHIIYSTAIISITTHALNQRKLHEEHRLHYNTHIALLESTILRLKSGERVPEKDLERLKKFSRDPEIDRPAALGFETPETIGWWEAMFGRKRNESTESARQRNEEWDRRDLDTLRKEVESNPSS